VKPLAKLTGWDFDPDQHHIYPDVFERQAGESWSRLAIGARQQTVALMLELCRTFDGPYSVLYILKVSRKRNECARYQSEKEMNFEETELFFDFFREYFEQDGRHHVWIGADGGNHQISYDNHDLLYAYGNLKRYETHLKKVGFSEGRVEIPLPHAHHYHDAFDAAETAILNYWPWTKTPLLDIDRI